MRIATLVAVLLLAAASDARAAGDYVRFQDLPNTYAGPEPRTLEVANLNGDQWPDLIVGNSYENPHITRIGGLWLLEGHRGGNWSVLTHFEETHQVHHVAALDFDGDGDDDIAYSVVSTLGEFHGFRILRNENPGFVLVAEVPFFVLNFGGLAAGDFDGDGLDDLAYTQDGPGLLLLSRDNGTFESRELPAVRFTAPAVGDLNGDGRDDLVVATDDRKLLLFLGDAELGLRELAPLPLRHDGAEVAISDVDGSGTLDVVVSHASMVTIEIFLDAGRATQQAPAYHILNVVRYGWPAVGDLDRDGVDDVVFFASEGVQTVHFQRTGPPRIGGAWFVPGRIVGGYNEDIGIGDFDRDGDLDAVVATDQGLATLYNDGRGGFIAPPFTARSLAAGDFNGDGRDDLLGHDGVRLARTGGEFGRQPMRDAFSGPHVRFGGAADMNRDSRLDSVIVYARSATSTRERVEVRFGNGDGTLAPPVTTLLTNVHKHAELHELTGDGVPDLLLVTSPDEVLQLSKGNTDGTFAVPVKIAASGYGHRGIGDVDGDGDLDLLATGLGPWVYRNDGSGGFGDAVEAVDMLRGVVEMADLDGDGLEDAVVADASRGYVGVYLSNGDGTFTAQPRLDSRLDDTNDVNVDDFNGDGFADVLVTEGGTTASDGFMMLFFGDGTGAFPRLVRMRSAASQVRVGDFDGDGDTDLLDGGFVRLNECAPTRRRSSRH